MTYGFVKLYRDILESPIYDNSNAVRLYIHILLKANIEDKQWNEILIKKGQFLTSLRKLTEELGLTLQNIRTAIKTLEKFGFIASETTKIYTIFTLKSNTEDNIVSNTDLTNNQHTTNTVKSIQNDIILNTLNTQPTQNLTQNLTTTKEVKEYKEKEKELNNKTYMCVMEKWNSITKGILSPVKILNPAREKKIKEILKQFQYDINSFDLVFKNLINDSFSVGKNERNWKADFDYIIRMDKFIKFYEISKGETTNDSNGNNLEDLERGKRLLAKQRQRDEERKKLQM